MDKEYVIDNKVMGIHLDNIRTALGVAISYNNTVVSCKAERRIKAFMVRNNLNRIKEQVAMAELYIAKETDDEGDSALAVGSPGDDL